MSVASYSGCGRNPVWAQSATDTFNSAEFTIAALLEATALEDDARQETNASADVPDAVPLLDDLSALGDPCLRW